MFHSKNNMKVFQLRALKETNMKRHSLGAGDITSWSLQLKSGIKQKGT